MICRHRLDAAGIVLEARESFIAEHGEVYPANEVATRPEAPVYSEENLGYTVRKYLVMAPTGMKLHPRSFAGLGAGNIGKRIDFVKNKLEGVSISIAVNLTDLESSGSRSSILAREGASTGINEAMMIRPLAGNFVVQAHAEGGSLRLQEGFSVPGNFAHFREVGGYDTQKDALVRSLQIAGNLAGIAANKSKTVEMAVDLDGANTSRMMLQGLMTFNKGLVDKLKSGL
jgi:hypothetical protein